MHWVLHTLVIFSSLLQLNLQMQGNIIIDMCDKIQGFQTRLDPLNRRVQKGVCANFPIYEGRKVSKSNSKISEFGFAICQHLTP